MPPIPRAPAASRRARRTLIGSIVDRRFRAASSSAGIAPYRETIADVERRDDALAGADDDVGRPDAASISPRSVSASGVPAGADPKRAPARSSTATTRRWPGCIPARASPRRIRRPPGPPAAHRTARWRRRGLSATMRDGARSHRRRRAPRRRRRRHRRKNPGGADSLLDGASVERRRAGCAGAPPAARLRPPIISVHRARPAPNPPLDRREPGPAADLPSATPAVSGVSAQPSPRYQPGGSSDVPVHLVRPRRRRAGPGRPNGQR